MIVTLVVDDICQIVVTLEEDSFVTSRSIDDPHDNISVARRQGKGGKEVGKRASHEGWEMWSQEEMVVETSDAVFPFADGKVLLE